MKHEDFYEICSGLTQAANLKKLLVIECLLRESKFKIVLIVILCYN